MFFLELDSVTLVTSACAGPNVHALSAAVGSYALTGDGTLHALITLVPAASGSVYHTAQRFLKFI